MKSRNNKSLRRKNRRSRKRSKSIKKDGYRSRQPLDVLVPDKFYYIINKQSDKIEYYGQYVFDFDDVFGFVELTKYSEEPNEAMQNSSSREELITVSFFDSDTYKFEADDTSAPEHR